MYFPKNHLCNVSLKSSLLLDLVGKEPNWGTPWLGKWKKQLCDLRDFIKTTWKKGSNREVKHLVTPGFQLICRKLFVGEFFIVGNSSKIIFCEEIWHNLSTIFQKCWLQIRAPLVFILYGIAYMYIRYFPIQILFKT